MDAELRDRFRFMRDNAGYRVGRRAAGALELARAEAALEGSEDHRVRFVVDDENPVTAWDDDPAMIIAAAEEFGVWGAIAERRCSCCGEWRDVGSLWGIIGDADYRRVVAAEMAAEYLS